MSGKPSTAKGLGCLILFALPFAGVGVFMGFRMVVFTAEWVEMKSWVAVEARIVSANLYTSQGDDSVSYEARATYTYSFDGREYTGSRVALHTGADSVGGFQERAYGEVAAARGQPFACWVDPDEPSSSVLYRDLRWEMVGFHLLFVVLFGGVGFGLVFAGLYGSKKLKADDGLRASYPDEPWLHKEEWVSGRIRSSSKAQMWFAVGFASFWLLVSSPTVFIVYQAFTGEQEPVAFVAALFPIVGLGLGYWAVKSVARYRKFGESVFEMQTIPGVIGGPVAGTVKTVAFDHVQGGFDATLSCVRGRRSGRGKNRRTSEHVAWQSRRRFAYDRARDGLPVSFRVPFDCEASSEEDPNNRLLWKLTVEGKNPGVDYHAEFEIPVFKTEHSSEAAGEVAELDDADSGVIDAPLADRLRESGARVENLPSGSRYIFPMARQPGIAATMTGFFVVWTGIVVALVHFEAPALFPWLFGLFDLIFLIAMLDMWLHASTIEVRPGQLSFASGWFGGRDRTLASSAVEKFATKRGSQSGNKLYYRLVVQEHGGDSHMLAKGIADHDTAERLANELERTLRAGG